MRCSLPGIAVPVACGIVAAAVAPLYALSVLPLPHAQAVMEADGIARGTVVERRTALDDGNLLPITTLVLRVDERLSGPPAPEVMLEFAGGMIDGVAHAIADLPVPEVGDELIVFYRAARDGRLSNVVGINQWYFRLADQGRRLLDHAGRVLVGFADGVPTAVDAAALDTAPRSRETPCDGVIEPDGTVRPRAGRRATRATPEPMGWDALRAVTLDVMASPAVGR